MLTCLLGAWPWLGSSGHWRSQRPLRWAAWEWPCCSDKGSRWYDSPPQCHWWRWASAWATPASGSTETYRSVQKWHFPLRRTCDLKMKNWRDESVTLAKYNDPSFKSQVKRVPLFLLCKRLFYYDHTVVKQLECKTEKSHDTSKPPTTTNPTYMYTNILNTAPWGRVWNLELYSPWRPKQC